MNRSSLPSRQLGAYASIPGALAKGQHRRTAAVVLVLLALGVMTLGLMRVRQQQRIIRLGFELGEARATLQRLQEEQNRLRLEESVLTNPGRIESLAGSLGMVRPRPDQLRVIQAHPSVATLDRP